MTRCGFTNMDSRALAQLAEDFQRDDSATAAMLLRIADNLQRLDEANQILSNNRTYEQGVADAEARMRRRSNVLENPDGEDDRGAAILRQIDQRVAEGNVKKLALGERALEDKPHMFNGPAPRKAKPAAKPTTSTLPTELKLDLTFLGDL